MISLIDILHRYYPETEWRIIGEASYNNLTWNDKIVEKPSEEEINLKIEELSLIIPYEKLREERNAKIAKTDWRATIDYSGTDQEAWLTYRQALRDLPATAEPELDGNGMLTNVTWPEEPV